MTDNTIIELKEGYLLITAEGVRDNFESIIEGTKRIQEAAKAYGTKYILVDYRKLRYNVPLADAFNLVKTYENELPDFSDIIISGVVHRSDLELAKFWESICNKRGYQYKVFLDYNKAEEWITEQSTIRKYS